MKKIYLISFIALIIDQIVKFIVSNNMIIYDSIKIIKNFFYITYAQNKGAAFSILSGSRYFLILVSVAVLILIIRYLKKINKLQVLEIISFGLIIGGTIGNLIDRLIYGYVIDYLDFMIINYDFPIFNLADSFIVIGAILLIANSYWRDRVENKS